MDECGESLICIYVRFFYPTTEREKAMKCGIDNRESLDKHLKGKRLGLITSVAAVNEAYRQSTDVLFENYELTALYSPEHGVRGDRGAGDYVDSYRDPKTGVPVHSLFRKDSKRFTREQLSPVDAVVYDIQDLGVRYYTFISTLLMAVEECARNGKELIVLDRPCPLGGAVVEGSVLRPEYASFVGAWAIPTRYGLTAGELALMYNDVQHIGCQLHVVPCEGWHREDMFPSFGRPWIMPSLGIPRFETALLYPGMCLVEGTNLSEGRGTSCPFELIGADFLSAEKLTQALNRRKLPGVCFTPAYFTPSASKFGGVACQGVHAHITNPETFQSYRTGLVLLETVRELCPEQFQTLPPAGEDTRPFLTLLNGDDRLLGDHWTAEQVLHGYEAALAAFRTKKQAYHLYD